MSTAVETGVLLVGGSHHLTPVVLRYSEDVGPPPTVRPIALPDDKIMGLVFPITWKPEGDAARVYAFEFENNCYRRTDYKLDDGRPVYSWVGNKG